MANKAPARRAIDAVLADNEWHEVVEVVEKAIDAVPINQAYAIAERERLKNGGPPDRIRGDAGKARRSGARRVVIDALSGATAAGTIIRVGDRVRRRP